MSQIKKQNSLAEPVGCPLAGWQIAFYSKNLLAECLLFTWSRAGKDGLMILAWCATVATFLFLSYCSMSLCKLFDYTASLGQLCDFTQDWEMTTYHPAVLTT